MRNWTRGALAEAKEQIQRSFLPEDMKLAYQELIESRSGILRGLETS